MQASIHLREARTTFLSAIEGDVIHVDLIQHHPIVKIRFGGNARITGEFVDHKHGVLRIRDQKKRLISVPGNVIIGAELDKA